MEVSHRGLLVLLSMISISSDTYWEEPPLLPTGCCCVPAAITQWSPACGRSSGSTVNYLASASTWEESACSCSQGNKSTQRKLFLILKTPVSTSCGLEWVLMVMFFLIPQGKWYSDVWMGADGWWLYEVCRFGGCREAGGNLISTAMIIEITIMSRNKHIMIIGAWVNCYVRHAHCWLAGRQRMKEGNMKDARLLFHKLITGRVLMVSDDIKL